MNSIAEFVKEKASEYHVISAGSLLSTLLAKPKSYPVGMVYCWMTNFIHSKSKNGDLSGVLI